VEPFRTDLRHPSVLPLGEATRTWARVALLSFGGPAGQIAVMHRILVEEKRWIGERRFLHALNYCMLLPGPEAQQLAIYIGWLLNRTAGGLIAGGLFVAPGLVVLMALSILYARFGAVGAVGAFFFGLKAAVLVIVFEAVMRVGRRALKNRVMIGLAAGAFVALFAFAAPFPAVIAIAGLIGFLGARAGHPAFLGGAAHGAPAAGEVSDADSLLGDAIPAHARPSLGWALRVCAVILTLWLAPTLIIGFTLGWDNVFSRIAVFFSKMAVVTFGGAYSVLAYVAQEAVHTQHWLRPGEMLDGLGMAETTPGPLIIVTQFVGFMGAFRGAQAPSPLLAGVLGGLLTTWVTFTPCFLWIFLGAPFAEALREARALNGALRAITAAVVGVILNLAVWFALHLLFRQTTPIHQAGLALDAPVLSTLNWPSAVLTAAAAIAAFRFKVGMIPLLIACAAAGVAWYYAVGQGLAVG
jgi:chromate transporter